MVYSFLKGKKFFPSTNKWIFTTKKTTTMLIVVVLCPWNMRGKGLEEFFYLVRMDFNSSIDIVSNF